MEKYWGNIDIDSFKEAVQKFQELQKEYNGRKEIRIQAVKFDSGNLGLSIYNKRYKGAY